MSHANNAVSLATIRRIENIDPASAPDEWFLILRWFGKKLALLPMLFFAGITRLELRLNTNESLRNGFGLKRNSREVCSETVGAMLLAWIVTLPTGCGRRTITYFNFRSGL